MNETYRDTLDALSLILTLIYNVEAGIKIFAYDWDYFITAWNRFDLLVVLISDISLLGELKVLKKSEFFRFLKVLRALRIMRIFRLIRVSKNLRVLVDSLMVILPSVINVGSLIFLLFFIFAVIGMNLFAGVIHQREINENSNFTNFGMSIIVLMRCTTGEGWNKIMRELSINETTPIYRTRLDGTVYSEYCVKEQSHESFIADGPKECGNFGSFIFFTIFIIIIQMMMLNLFIAVVVEGFASTNKEHTGTVTSVDYQKFVDQWLLIDHNATGWISLENIVFLLHELDAPLGYRQAIDRSKYIDDLVG